MTTADVMAVVLPIWTGKHEAAQRVRSCISAIMKWAIAQGYPNDNPAGDAIADRRLRAATGGPTVRPGPA